MNALPDREGTLHACCGRLCLHGATMLVPLTSPSRFATWEPDRAQETQRALSPSVLVPVFPQSSFPSTCPALFSVNVPLPIPAVSFLPSWTCCCLRRADSSAQGALPWGAPTAPILLEHSPPPLHLAGALLPHPAGALPSDPPSCWSTPPPTPSCWSSSGPQPLGSLEASSHSPKITHVTHQPAVL